MLGGGVVRVVVVGNVWEWDWDWGVGSLVVDGGGALEEWGWGKGGIG